MVPLSHPYMTIGKTIALTICLSGMHMQAIERHIKSYIYIYIYTFIYKDEDTNIYIYIYTHIYIIDVYIFLIYTENKD